MISLLKMSDKTGKIYHYGNMMMFLENGVKIYADANEDTKALVWIPKEIMPEIYELKKMCDEKIMDRKMKSNLLWPEKLLYDSSNDQCCGYVTSRPEISGKIISLNEYIERNRKFNAEERKDNMHVGMQLARIFKAIHDTKSGYVLGTVSVESFWIDEKLNVFYLEAYNCSNNMGTEIKTYYIAPEILMCDSWNGKFNAQSDAFVFALLLFQIFTGKFPYESAADFEKIDVEYMWGLMCDGESVFYNNTETSVHMLLEELNNYSQKIKELFCRVFDYCGRINYVEERPGIDEWMEALSEHAARSSEKL